MSEKREQTKIAFYLNLQGAGHCRRFEAIAPYFPPECELAVVGMDGPPPIADVGRPVKCVNVPGFAPAATVPFVQQQTTHDYHGFAVNHGDNSAFALAMVSFLSEWKPDLLVADVGLEASILARMCGIATMYSRQHGRRWDKGHRLAYEWACGLYAPFASEMEQQDCPDWVKEKTFYSGGFCRFSGREKAAAPQRYERSKPNVLVMTGFGGTKITPEHIVEAAAANPQWQWNMLGQTKQQPAAHNNVVFHGIVEDVWPYLCFADLAIANAGHNCVMEIAAAQVPAVFIPAQRPFDEQQCKADVLKRLNLGVVVQQWPQAGAWQAIWNRAHEQDLSRWATLQDPDAPKRTAAHIASIARQCMRV